MNAGQKIKQLYTPLEYHFGGFAKRTAELLEFKSDFQDQTGILLDSVYNAKSFYAFFDLAAKGHFHPGKKVLLIHTGGLQGEAGFTV